MTLVDIHHILLQFLIALSTEPYLEGSIVQEESLLGAAITEVVGEILEDLIIIRNALYDSVQLIRGEQTFTDLSTDLFTERIDVNIEDIHGDTGLVHQHLLNKVGAGAGKFDLGSIEALLG